MPDFGSKKVSFEKVKCLYATASAIKVEVLGEIYWIPNSQVDDDSEVYREGDTGTLVISEWVATEKGLV